MSKYEVNRWEMKETWRHIIESQRRSIGMPCQQAERKAQQWKILMMSLCASIHGNV